MHPIHDEYAVLFNAITDAENTLRSLQTKLMLAQALAEEIYISAGGQDEMSGGMTPAAAGRGVAEGI